MIRCCEEGYDKDEGDRQYDYGLNEVVGKDACRFVISWKQIYKADNNLIRIKVWLSWVLQ